VSAESARISGGFSRQIIYTVVPCVYHFNSRPGLSYRPLPFSDFACGVVHSVFISVLRNGYTGPDRSETDQGEACYQSTRISRHNCHGRVAVSRVQGGMR
jgi:hypothetical protein